jgi:hypothetical protein
LIFQPPPAAEKSPIDCSFLRTIINAMPHLSGDIISCILDLVPARSGLCNIARCSSRFYWLTVPYLYAHVELYSRGRSSFKYLRSLTVLLLRKPTLAHCARQFTLRDPYDRRKPNFSRGYQTSKVEGLLEEAILANSHSIEEYKGWVGIVSADGPDAILAILLPTMVRLEKLDLMLRPYYLYFDRMIIRAVTKEKPFDRQPLLPELTSFMHARSWELDYYNTTPDCYGRADPTWEHPPVSSKYSILFQNFPRIRSIYGFGINQLNEHNY